MTRFQRWGAIIAFTESCCSWRIDNAVAVTGMQYKLQVVGIVTMDFQVCNSSHNWDAWDNLHHTYVSFSSIVTACCST